MDRRETSESGNSSFVGPVSDIVLFMLFAMILLDHPIDSLPDPKSRMLARMGAAIAFFSALIAFGLRAAWKGWRDLQRKLGE